MGVSRGEAPPAVSKRNHFETAGTLVDSALHSLPAPYQTPELKHWLVRHTERVIRHVAHYFSVGAERGIKQTANLLVDPAYYSTLKDRRRRQRERVDEQQKRFEIERAERRICPTEAEISQDIAQLEQWIPSEEKHLAGMKARLEQLKNLRTNAKHIRFPRLPQ